ncbi:hypothetical protein JCM3766R1_000510 [Sporobolomyces carnicolor]
MFPSMFGGSGAYVDGYVGPYPSDLEGALPPQDFPRDCDYSYHDDSRDLPGAYSDRFERDSHLPNADLSLEDWRPYHADPAFDFDRCTNWIDSEVPMRDAWTEDYWDDQQYALADLLALEEDARLRQYQLYNTRYLARLGLSDGFWGRRFGGRPVELSYLRSVPLRRGLFSAPYRSRFARHRTIGRRYQPYLSRPSRFAAQSLPPRASSSYRPYPMPQALEPRGPSPSSLDFRTRELTGRLRIAELQASLASLSPVERAHAHDEARRIRRLLSDREYLARQNVPGSTFEFEELRREQDEIRRDWESRRRTDQADTAIESAYRDGALTYRGH